MHTKPNANRVSFFPLFFNQDEVTACMACANLSTVLLVTPAMEILPFLVM